MGLGPTKKTLAMGLLALCTVLAVPGAASAKTETVTVGQVTAELSYDEKPKGFPAFSNVREKIIRGGTAFIDQPAPASPSCAECAGLPAFGGRANSVEIVQLDATPEPEVVFNFFTGGAHCCYFSHILRFDAGAYTGILHDWLDPFYTFKDLGGDGTPEFVSADGRFGYVFGSFAGSRFPPQIWRYENGALVDVTRQFPDLIKAAAGKLKRTYNRNPDRLGVEQVLLGFTADECLLDRCGAGFKLIKKATRGEFVKRGFLGKVKRFLRGAGYV